MFHMKTASVRELRLDFARVSKWLEDGEPVAITKRGQAFATLVPAKETKAHKAFKVPDFAGQMREMFGDRMLTTEDSAAIRDAMRGER
ncbi:MAG: prevent-host-death protein [Verrucomicrobiaceae bacterium]|nr:prevent-host-death protein [Verrucomicrobiaceae bacterium]